MNNLLGTWESWQTVQTLHQWFMWRKITDRSRFLNIKGRTFCIARVGEAVIRKQAEAMARPFKAVQYVIPPEPVMDAIICDLDGTLSLFEAKGHRGPYDASRCDEDDVNPVVRNILEVYYRFMHYQVIYLSGREEKYRPQTMTFLRQNHCPPGSLFMRPTGDMRKDYIVKSELFDTHVREKFFVRFVLDDRNQVVDFWRSIGLTCLQVADGAF